MSGTPARLTLTVPTLGRRPEWLRDALESVRRQDVPIRVVVVAPAEATADLRRATGDLDAVVVAQTTRGLTAAINEGFRLSETEYVGWLGDDDLLIPRTAHLLVDELDRRPEAPLAYGRIYIIDGDGRYRFTVRPTRWAPGLVSVLRNFMPQQGTVFRRSAVQQVGFLDESLDYAMDLDAFLRLRPLGPAAYVPVPVAAFRYHDEGLTLTNPHWGVEARDVRRRHAGPLKARLVTAADTPLGIATRIVYKLGVLRADQSAAQLNAAVGVLPPA